MSLYISVLIKMERLLKPNPHKSSPLQTLVFRRSLDGEEVLLSSHRNKLFLGELFKTADIDRSPAASSCYHQPFVNCLCYVPPVLPTKHPHRRGIMSSKGKLLCVWTGDVWKNHFNKPPFEWHNTCKAIVIFAFWFIDITTSNNV